jgi:hypothetical protein
MLGRSGSITTAVLLAGLAVPATAAGAEQGQRSASASDGGQRGTSAEIDGARRPLSNYHPPGVSTGRARNLPPAQRAAPIEVRVSEGFDWGDAGVGAAGMLVLLSIIAGSTLLVISLRRRRASTVLTR